METTKSTEGLSINTTFVRTILTNFIKDGIRNPGFTKGIVGLSGGIDSAVAAALAKDALGKENVIAVFMPFRSSNPQSEIDANLVASHLGISLEKVDITPMVERCIDIQKVDKVRAGNVMARMRMIVLFDISQRDRGLVIGTSNKTEVFLGYGTLYGDMACALNPLGDLYKSQVWQLAIAMNLPNQIIRKKPSADLWEGQTDEDELGFTYGEVDRLLYYMIDQRRSIAELESMNFPRAFIEKVRVMVKNTQYKRRLPIVAKVSHRTVNLDFQYARDWGI